MKYFLAAVVVLNMLASSQAYAEFMLQPSLMLSEEYNDNLLLENPSRYQDYISRVDPSLALHYRTSLWLWDGSYTLDYRHYEKYHQYDTTDHVYTVRNLTELINDFLFVEMTDDYRRVSTDITRDYTQQSPIVHQTEQHVVTVHPYMIVRVTDTTTLTYGHLYMDTRYRGDGINRTDNTDYLRAVTAVTSRLSTTISAAQTREKNSSIPDTDFVKVEVAGGFQYTYADRSFIYARAGKSWFKYDIGVNANYNQWEGGLTHRFSELTVSLVSAVLYVQDPLSTSTREDSYTASVTRETPRSTLTLSGALREFKDTITNELTSRSHEALGNFRYSLTPRTAALATGSFQRLDQRIPTVTYTDTTLSSLRFEHQLTEKATVSTEYRYLHSHSPDITANNYTNNRAIIELRILF